jgi:brefeldin A-inhibited guanine nucleotide-exchange protein
VRAVLLCIDLLSPCGVHSLASLSLALLPLFSALFLQVKPIAVADMLGLSNPAKSNAADASSITSAVQGFLNNVVAAAGYGAAVESHQQLKQSLTRSIMAPRASTDLGDNAAARVSAAGGADSSSQQQDEPVVVVTGEVSDDDEDEERGTFHLAGSGGSGSLATYSSSGTPKAAVAVAAGPAAAGSTGGAGGAAASHAGGAAAAAPHGAVVLPASVALLHKDAFLVFRALCKLSIRTSDVVTVSDPTAVRGKVSMYRVGQTVVPAGVDVHHCWSKCLLHPQ